MIGSTDFRTAAYFGLEDKWLDTGPGEVTHLHDMGTGTPVMFLHGSGTGVSAAANWWLTLPGAARSMRAIAPDLIGFGATLQADDAAFGIREWGAHTLRILDALGIEKTWLVGNSLGGWIALQLAIDHPDRLHGVISMGTGGAAPTAAIRSHSAPDISFEGMRRAFGGFVTDPTLVDDEMIRARQAVAEYEVASHRLDRVIKARERDRSALPLDNARLAEIDLPVLLIHGREDIVIPVSRTWDLVNIIPRADAVILHGCGHWSQVERAETFYGLLSDFIEAH